MRVILSDGALLVNQVGILIPRLTHSGEAQVPAAGTLKGH
jgi:hypothetical protein